MYSFAFIYYFAAISLHSQILSVALFNGQSFSQWSEQVELRLGVLDLDLTLLGDKLIFNIELNNEEEKLYHKQ